MNRAVSLAAPAAAAIRGSVMRPLSFFATLPSFPGCNQAAPQLGVRGYATVTRRRRKEVARARAAGMRKLLDFASRYDHMRTARLELSQTLKRLGWAHNSGEEISEGVFADFTMLDHYLAFSVVAGEHYVPPGHPDASSIPGMPPVARDASGAVIMPHESPYPAAPPPWTNPVLGMVLDKETAARHSVIRSKGWSLVAIPLPLWRLARASPDQHYARRDLVMQFTLPLAPFELRPASTTTTQGGRGKKQ